jgi:hypothetical protein
VAEAVEDLEAVGTDPTTLRSNEGVAGRPGSPFFILLRQIPRSLTGMKAGRTLCSLGEGGENPP